MKKHHLLVVMAIAWGLLTTTYAQAQDHSFVRESIEESLKEKVRIHDLKERLEAFERGELVPSTTGTRAYTKARAGVNLEVNLTNNEEAESEIHAAINPADTNNIIAAAMYQNPNNFLAPLEISTYYTTDFGQTWQKSDFVGSPPAGGLSLVAGGGDPVISFDSEGEAHMTWLLLEFSLSGGTISFYHASSDDGGATWVSREKPLARGTVSLDFAGPQGIGIEDRFVDKQWMATDRSGGMYHDNIYMAYVNMQTAPDTAIDMVVQVKAADADTFTTEQVKINSDIYAGTQFASIDVDGDGTIHTSFWGSKTGFDQALYYTQSTDGGKTFRPEVKISNMVIPQLGDSAGLAEAPLTGVTRLYPDPHLRVDASNGPHRGNLYATWTALGRDERETEGYDIYFSKSTDGGLNWTPARVLNNDQGEEGDLKSNQFFAAMDVNEEGTIVVGFYDTRDDTANVNTHYYFAYSTDGGDTFDDQFPVSGTSADFSVIGDKNAGFGIGEYTEIVTTSNYAIPVWADGRGNDGSVQVFAALVDLSSGTTTQISTLESGIEALNMYPNPGRNQAVIDLELERSGAVEIEAFDLQGKLVYQHKSDQLAGKNTHEIQVADWEPGMYIFRIGTERGFIAKRWVKQ